MASSYFLVLILALITIAQGDVTQRTNKRCALLCKEESARVAQSHQPDCQRGCRYFNIEYLTAATTEDEVVDSAVNSKDELQTVLGQCKILCRDAYPSDGLRRDACSLGCHGMFQVQSKAPVIPNGGETSWVVYMGAGAGGNDQNLLVLQPPELLENSDSGWVLLNSIFRPSHDYDLSASSSSSSGYKLTETHVQTMPISGSESSSRHRFGEFRRPFRSPFCIPAWLWLIPVMLVVALVYIQYNGTSLKSVLVLEEESDDELEIIVETRPSAKDKDNLFLMTFQEDFLNAKLKDLPPKYEQVQLQVEMKDQEK